MNKDIVNLYKERAKASDENKKYEITEKIAIETQKLQSHKLENEITKLKAIPHGRITRIFKIKEMLTGPKKKDKKKLP